MHRSTLLLIWLISDPIQMAEFSRRNRSGFAWLECLFAIAVLVLAVQLLPGLWRVLLRTVDVRSWSRTMWFAMNIVVLVLLLAIRFSPQLVNDWRTRKLRLTAEQTREQKQQEVKEQRDTLERMKQAQRRRIY